MSLITFHFKRETENGIIQNRCCIHESSTIETTMFCIFVRFTSIFGDGIVRCSKILPKLELSSEILYKNHLILYSIHTK